MNAATQRGPGDRPALTRLTDLSRADFAPCWGERPLLARHDDAFADLFSADAVDELLAEHGLRTPFARMAAQGSVLPSSQFTASGGVGAEIGDQLDSAKILEQFANGATLVLQGLHRTWAPISEFTRSLVADLGHPAQVNAYITPDAARGFDPHYDTHDVFVIQIAGAKRWTIHEPVLRHPLGNQPWNDHREDVATRAREEPAIDAVFEPGDVLYLPRGWLHSAVAQGGTSIHLTIGVRATTRHDLLQKILARAAESEALRAPLALGTDYTDPSSMAEDLRATAEATNTVLEALDATDIAPLMQADFVQATRPEPVRPMRTVELLSDLPPGLQIAWRQQLAADIVADAKTVSIRLREKTVSLPVEAENAVRALFSSAQRAGSLPELDAESSLVVARRLLREGIAVPCEDR